MTSLPGGSHSASNRDDAIIATQSRRRLGQRLHPVLLLGASLLVLLAAGGPLPEFLVTRFAYCLLVWNFLVLVRSFRVASFAPLFLCGAVNGRVAAGFEYRRMARSWSNRRIAR